MIIVSDTTPVNYLVLIGEIELLPALYGQILLPPAVHLELQQSGTPAPVVAWARSLPAWAQVKAPQQIGFTARLDPGEREAIALALEEKATLVLMDEQRGRAFARQQGLIVTGTLGVLEDAASRGLVDLPRAFQQLQGTSFQVSAALLQAILQRNALAPQPPEPVS